MDRQTRVMLIEERIREVFLEHSVAVFWADHFTEQLGTLGEARDALEELVRRGKLITKVTLYSAEGCDCWEGGADDFPKMKPFTCEHCGAHSGDDGRFTVVRYPMSDAFKGAVSTQKKSLLASSHSATPPQRRRPKTTSRRHLLTRLVKAPTLRTRP